MLVVVLPLPLVLLFVIVLVLAAAVVAVSDGRVVGGGEDEREEEAEQEEEEGGEEEGEKEEESFATAGMTGGSRTGVEGGCDAMTSNGIVVGSVAGSMFTGWRRPVWGMSECVCIVCVRDG